MKVAFHVPTSVDMPEKNTAVVFASSFLQYDLNMGCDKLIQVQLELLLRSISEIQQDIGLKVNTVFFSSNNVLSQNLLIELSYYRERAHFTDTLLLTTIVV